MREPALQSESHFPASLANVSLDKILGLVEAIVMLLDGDGCVTYFNPACERLSGYRANDVAGKRIYDFLIPAEEARDVCDWLHKLNGHSALVSHSSHWVAKDGTRHLVKWCARKLEAGHEGFYYVISGADITENEQRDVALADSQAFLKAIIDASPVGIVTLDDNGIILGFNRQAEAIFGYQESDAVGRSVAMLMTDEERSRHEAYLRRYFTSAKSKVVGVSRAVTARRADGEEFPAIVHAAEFRDGRRILVGFIEDVTEKKATERRLDETRLQLYHASRIGAMGEMATSIAHELNQPLTAAASFIGAVNISLAKERLSLQAQTALVLLDDAIAEIRRASEIIRQMREFVRKRRIEKSLVDVNKVIEEACVIALIGAHEYGIDVTLKCRPDVGQACVDRIQIQQVVTNLILNAIDAMRDSPRRRLTLATEREGAFVEIRVEDTGTGIPDAVKDRLFEPFVTSKPEGTGIGLSISRSIVQAHGGDIRAEDNVGGGAVFVVRLPTGTNDEEGERR